MKPEKDRREHIRIEPAKLDVRFSTNGIKNHGWLLDVSQGGASIALPHEPEHMNCGMEIDLSIFNPDNGHESVLLEKAKILRTWSEMGTFDDTHGLTAAFQSPVETSVGKHINLFRGITQDTRLFSQNQVAAHDVKYLGHYINDIMNSQVTLLITALTVGATLAVAYFTMNFYEKTITLESNFWRMLVAFLPGCVSMGCGLMVAQKSIALQKIEAYISVIKNCIIKQQFPREYKGWEIESYKIRHIFKSRACKDCMFSKNNNYRKCGELTNIEKRYLKQKSLFNPKINLNNAFMFIIFYAISGLSTIIVIRQVASYQDYKNFFPLVTAFLGLLLLASMIWLFILLWRLRKGRYSIIQFRRIWIDLFTRCREKI